MKIVAPQNDQSAKSHSRLPRRPVFSKKIYRGRDLYAGSGTPVDCVFYGIHGFYPGEIDLVISGINHGLNLGPGRYISATVAAAREAAFPENGLVGVAISTEVGKHEAQNFKHAARFCRDFTMWLSQVRSDPALKEMLRGTYFNINMPAWGPQGIQGIALTHPAYDSGKRVSLTPVDGGVDEVEFDSNWDDHALTPDKFSDHWMFQEGYLTLSILSLVKNLNPNRKLEDLFLQDFNFDGMKPFCPQ